MISSSQITLSGIAERTSTVLDRQRAEFRLQGPPAGARGNDEAGQGRELVLSRDAQLRYSSNEGLAFARAGRVSGQNGADSLLASATVSQRASEQLLTGQTALRVGRAALGGGAGGGVETGGSARLQTSRYTFVSQSESRQVAASGTVELANGQTVDFSLALSQRQQRQYEFSETVRIEERPMTDPLVINFDSPSARLSDTMFEFDLDSDGEADQLATLGAGSGYLAFDRNGNGEVDDGGELFGPASGSGFNELSRFDEDGNRWVDSSDPIFGKLGVMVQAADGSSELRSLESVGVEALYTGSTRDQFTLTSRQGVPLGEIKATGLYLTDRGEVRTMEELDLAERGREPAPPETEVLARTGGETAPGSGPAGTATEAAANERIETIRQALEKLNAIRERQEAFIEKSQGGEEGRQRTVLDEFMAFADQLRIDLLERQERNQQALKAYRDTSLAGPD